MLLNNADHASDRLAMHDRVNTQGVEDMKGKGIVGAHWLSLADERQYALRRCGTSYAWIAGIAFTRLMKRTTFSSTMMSLGRRDRLRYRPSRSVMRLSAT